MIKRLLNSLTSILFIFFSILFLLIGLNVKFIQNDEWAYYLTVESFLRGIPVIHPYISSVFYLQAGIGTLWAFLFGINAIPLLTAIISSISVIVFVKTLNLLQISRTALLIVTALFSLNPLFIYSVIGFMTEQYFLLPFLVSVYFIANIEATETNVRRNYIFSNIFIWISYFSRQVAIATSLAFAMYLLSTKRIKLGVLQLVQVSLMLMFHVFVLPKTAVMVGENLNLINNVNLLRFFQMLYTQIIYLIAFTLPLCLSAAHMYTKKLKGFTRISFALSGLTLAIILQHVFRSVTDKTQIFPLLGNVFNKDGFITWELMKSVNDLWHMNVFFYVWEVVAIFVMGYVLLIIIISKKSFFIFYLLTYVGSMTLITFYYDRYLLPVIATSLLYLSKLLNEVKMGYKMLTICAGVFLFVLINIDYQFVMEFITRSSYLWNRSKLLVHEHRVQNNLILSNYSWNRLYPNITGEYTFIFSFLSPDVFSNKSYKLIETHKNDYLFSVRLHPYVYIYERRSANFP